MSVPKEGTEYSKDGAERKHVFEELKDDQD